MEILLGVIMGIIFGLAGILWAYFYIRRQMLKVEIMLSTPFEQLKEGSYDMDETIEAKIRNRLYRIFRDLEIEYKEADTQKKSVQRYIADLSHQIKTPMANLFLYNGLLTDEELTAKERREFLDRTEDELKKLNWLFSELTKVTRLEGGAITLACENQSAWFTLMEAVEKIRVQAEDRGIKITVAKIKEEGFNPEYTACHSRKWTVEALVNILENAVKYSKPEGHIKISIEELELYTRILIKDNGRGVLKEDYPKIFQRFYRGENVKNEAGSGLGLYLAQLILNMEEGYITVSSEYGSGSTFSVYLRRGKHGQA